MVWPDALELLLVAARPTFAECDVVACAARPGALALRLFAGRVAARLPFAEPDVAEYVAWPDVWELWLVAGRLPFAEPDVAARRALRGPEVPLAHARRSHKSRVSASWPPRANSGHRQHGQLYIFFEFLLQKVVGFDEPVGKAR